MRQLHFTVVSGEEEVTQFMQDVAAFEPGKVYAAVYTYQAVLDPVVAVDAEYCRKVLGGIVDASRRAKRIPVIIKFDFFEDGDNRTDFGGAVPPHIEPGVRFISNGERFIPLADMLQHLGIHGVDECQQTG